MLPAQPRRHLLLCLRARDVRLIVANRLTRLSESLRFGASSWSVGSIWENLAHQLQVIDFKRLKPPAHSVDRTAVTLFSGGLSTSVVQRSPGPLRSGSRWSASGAHQCVLDRVFGRSNALPQHAVAVARKGSAIRFQLGCVDRHLGISCRGVRSRSSATPVFLADMCGDPIAGPLIGGACAVPNPLKLVGVSIMPSGAPFPLGLSSLPDDDPDSEQNVVNAGAIAVSVIEGTHEATRDTRQRVAAGLQQLLAPGAEEVSLRFAHWRMPTLAAWLNSRGVRRRNCARYTAWAKGASGF